MRVPPPNPVLLSFLPALALIPVLKEIIENAHSGGLEILFNFFLAAVHPSTDPLLLESAFKGIEVTVGISLISWTLSTFIGIFLGFLSSGIAWKNLYGWNWFGLVIKRLLAIPRAMHEVIWGLLLLQLMGLSIWVAILSITIPYSCLMARVVSDQLDNLDTRPLIALNQSGANRFITLITALFPPLIPFIKGYSCYRFECAIRSATLLGVFGLGGIGTELQLTLQSLEFRELWTCLWILFTLMAILEISLGWFTNINFYNDESIKSFAKVIIIFSSFIIAYFCIDSLNLKLQDNFNFSPIILPELHKIGNAFKDLPLIELVKSTLIMTLMSAGIAIGIPPLGLILWNSHLGQNVQSFIWLFLRLIPPPLSALLFLMCTEPSISVASLALGLTNIGVMGRVLKENLNRQNTSVYKGIKSSGATNEIAWIYGIFTPQSINYLSYAAYRTDVVLRETALVGVVGGVGLGWQLQESLSSFAWDQVLLITLIFITLTLIGELISDKTRCYWKEKATESSLNLSI